MADDNQALLLQLSADISKLEKAFKKATGVVDGESTKMELRGKRMAKKLEEDVGKANIGGALDKVFSSGRTKIMEEGAAKVGIFGGALEELGVAGLAAAGALAVVGEALNISREAAEFAHNIEITANRLHVTTDALQEYRYAVRAAGGEEAGADSALEAFNVTLGKAQEGLTKSVRPFLALGFTKAQIKGFKDADDALSQVTEKIAGLSSVQKDAVIQQLGLDGLKPLIEKGADAMKDLREEAHKLGIVMDGELVKRGSAINEKFETVSKVIGVQLKSALIDLGPILVGLLGFVDDIAKSAATVADQFRSIEDRTTEGLQERLVVLQKQRQTEKFDPQTSKGSLGDDLANMIAPDSNKDIDDEIKTIQGVLSARAAADKAEQEKLKASYSNLKDTSSTGGHKQRDSTAGYAASVDAAVANAQKSLLQAMLGLTDDFEARANLQKQILDQEAAAYAAESTKKRADIAASNDTDKKAQLAKLDLADATEKQANDVLRRGIEAEKEIGEAARRLDIQKTIADQQVAELQAQEDLTTDRKERARIEHEILDIQKKIADAERKNSQDALQLRANAASPDGTQVTVISNGKVQKSADATYADQSAAIDDQYAGPLKKWQQDNEDAVKNVQDAYEGLIVNGIDGFNQSLTDSLGNIKSFGQAFTQVIMRALADLELFELKKVEAGLFAAFLGGGGNSEPSNVQAALHPYIPGNADGTDNWRGGLTWVGERGKELVNLPRGAQVIPNHKVQSFSPVAAGAGGGMNITLHWTYEIAGAVHPSEISQAIERAHGSAVQRAVSEVRKNFGSMSTSYGKLGR